jgi:hypothetical protein
VIQVQSNTTFEMQTAECSRRQENRPAAVLVAGIDSGLESSGILARAIAFSSILPDMETGLILLPECSLGCQHRSSTH